jgi:hypothetical protein
MPPPAGPSQNSLKIPGQAAETVSGSTTTRDRQPQVRIFRPSPQNVITKSPRWIEAKVLAVSGNAPAGQLAVTGSTFFGGVEACCRKERTIAICNVGECHLHVSNVAFRHDNPHWKLINNPFPATLHPGSCLSVGILYHATEKFPRSCDLVITSDGPTTPVKILEVVAYTVWDKCCRSCGEDKCTCMKRRHDPCEPRKRGDEHHECDEDCIS